MANAVHPVARILLGCGWAVAVEAAAPSHLIPLAVASATAFLFPAVRLQLLRLLRRTRWLLLILLLTYGFTLPGAALWAGWASPSVEGLEQGGVRVVRLVLLLAGLALLLATTARPRLIYALYVLAKPLTGLGLDRRAFAVRLGLTLDNVEHAPKPAHWLDALRAAPSDEATPAVYTLAAERWQSRDSAVILAALLLVGIVLA